jgi:hypothetical protein
VKIRVSYTVDVDDGYRLAILHYSGGLATKKGLATRAQVVEWFRQHGETMDNDLRHEHGACCWGDPSQEEE